MRVLVTGGSGFLGNACIDAVQEAHPEWTLYSLDIRPSATQKNVGFLKADITSRQETQYVISRVNPDAIIHTAGWVPNGKARYSTDKRLRARVFEINVEGARNVVEAAKQTSCKALVHTSSCTVLSDDLNHDYPYMHEDIPMGNTTLSYGASKAAAEPIVLGANSSKLSTCALRPATIIGPGDNFGVIAAIYNCIAKWETPFIIGSGDNMYDFVYITNVADAHILALESLLVHHPSSPLEKPFNGDNGKVEKRESAAGKAFFISNQEPIYFRDFMLAIWAHFGHVPPFSVRVPDILANLVGTVADVVTWFTGADPTLSAGSVHDALGTRYSNNDRAVKVLGYVPRVGFVDAVRLACEDHERYLEMKEMREKSLNKLR
ncbi:hypothetical protein BDV97DRAFT_395721 [Delphinella strobiligena]|nr:hypothetical protein BDV97DRAFT_395721 [Delphinella strobiligena]